MDAPYPDNARNLDMQPLNESGGMPKLRDVPTLQGAFHNEQCLHQLLIVPERLLELRENILYLFLNFLPLVVSAGNLAEWLTRGPAKVVGLNSISCIEAVSHGRVSSNLTVVAFLFPGVLTLFVCIRNSYSISIFILA
jgi:hypothetical protein